MNFITEFKKLHRRVNSISGYKMYVALLSQGGSNPPVASVLKNTLGGTVVWSYNSPGSYTATLEGAFTVGKTWTSSAIGLHPDDLDDVEFFAFDKTIDSITFANVHNGLNTNSTMSDISIEIRVYH